MDLVQTDTTYTDVLVLLHVQSDISVTALITLVTNVKIPVEPVLKLTPVLLVMMVFSYMKPNVSPHVHMVCTDNTLITLAETVTKLVYIVKVD